MTNRKRDIEREQVEWVFRLTGGELEKEPWAGHQYWYEGLPEYSGDDFADDPSDTLYRTVVMQALMTAPPNEVDSEEGIWVLAKTYTSSGESECPLRYDADNGKIVQSSQTKEGVCELCGEAEGEDHGHIFLGDGWVEAVYRFTPPPKDN